MARTKMSIRMNTTGSALKQRMAQLKLEKGNQTNIDTKSIPKQPQLKLQVQEQPKITTPIVQIPQEQEQPKFIGVTTPIIHIPQDVPKITSIPPLDKINQEFDPRLMCFKRMQRKFPRQYQECLEEQEQEQNTIYDNTPNFFDESAIEITIGYEDEDENEEGWLKKHMEYIFDYF